MAFVVDSNVVIMFSTNVYKRIMASQLWASLHQWTYILVVRHQSAQWLPYSVNEPNEVNCNTPDMDTHLQFIKKLTHGCVMVVFD